MSVFCHNLVQKLAYSLKTFKAGRVLHLITVNTVRKTVSIKKKHNFEFRF